MNNSYFLRQEATVTHSGGDEYFLETSNGNFVWSDPFYGGSNKVSAFEGNFGNWLDSKGLEKGGQCRRRYLGDFLKKARLPEE